MDNQYTAIAGFYDELNSGTDYKGYALFIKSAFEKYAENKPEIVLDAACGTGSVLIELAKLGYDMIGNDLSQDMLSVAMGKAAEEGISPLLLNQNMCALDLYGTVDAAVCCLDSVNYLMGEGELEKCFSSINFFMNPGGIFVFDANTPYKFRTVYGCNDIIIESENSLCAWSNYFDEDTRVCEFVLSFFREEENGMYSRRDEIQHEREYSLDEIKAALDKSGFDIMDIVSDFDFSPCDEETERWYFVCKSRK